MNRFWRAGMAVLLSAGIAGTAAAQDCAPPDETEALAVIALRAHLMVAALQCRDGNGYNTVVGRFGEGFLDAQRRVAGHFARTSGERARTAFDRWNTTLANEWAEQARRLGPAICTESGALFQELAGTQPGAAFNAVAIRIAARVPAWIPLACRAPAAPSQP